MLIKTLPPQLPAGYQKTYLSREMSRAYAMDNPIGDPFGGAAYGEKNGPAIALALPIMGMVGSYGAMMAGSIMAGISFAGSALSLVGTVTGNQKLQRIGAVAGMIGGFGMNGGFGEAAKGATWGNTFGEAAAGSAASGAAAGVPAEALAQTPVANGVQVNQVPDTTSLADMTNNAGLSYAGNNLNTPGMTPGSLNASTGVPGSLNTGTGLADAFGNTGSPPADSLLTSNPGAPGTATAGVKPGFFDSLEAGNYWDATKAAGNNMMDLAKSNPGAAMMMGQAVSGLADYLSGKTDAEIDMLEAQTRAMNAQGKLADARAIQIQEEIEREKRRRANLNAGYSQVNTGINVNQNASIPMPWQQQQQQQQQPPQGGLINGARAGA